MSAVPGTAAVLGVLMRRTLNEILRVPGAAIPGILAPSIFMLGLTAVFGNLVQLRGFGTGEYIEFIVPVSLMQAASFSGAATGVNLARDIEQGWFDRLLVSPLPRPLLLLSILTSAAARALLPMTFTLVVALAIGVHWPGVGPVLLALVLASAFAAVAAAWTTTLALRFKTQSAAPLMQASMFMLVLFTPSYSPQRLLTGFLQDVARVNPVSKVVVAVRDCFVGGVTWDGTWPALVVLAAMAAFFSALALRGLGRTGV
ncbi:MAG: type transport system permease protein [Thermoleophilaceae bacterium]|jgi:ABC-2 type transport system permease protein|nr:type transport system permease protein [Thermoleophilaceae bacterium]